MSRAGRMVGGVGGGGVGLLLTSQALRGLGYGIAAVQLGAILRLDGLTLAGVGLMLAAILAGTGRPQREVVRGFGLYNAVAAVAGTVGALLGALPPDRRLLGGVLAVVGVAGVALAARLPASVEAPAVPPRGRVLARSRGPVTRLAALFAVESLAGGFVVQAYLGYWLSLRYGATTQTIGVTFAMLGVLQTASLLAAPLVAARVGLLRTMVFTHIPSNLLLAAVPFAPGLGGAIALLMARACLSQMDVPTRQAYVMALVPESERTAAAAVTNTARYLTRPAGPALAGLILPFGLALPFVIAGAAKTAYDLTLWRIFRSARRPALSPIEAMS
ncbi:Transmembrane secretion effector [Nonomuraea solani]|uniref:Transmembrane secretion effector n=1 Tax=Nonomuraea solani TaxID=1144553 RepID=A0A1H6F0R5_9ACTN|nr:MFS transporter [Nonomuraea solani]SEH03730.1 Transmembrane secretion effector [Nonomuraea solani]